MQRPGLLFCMRYPDDQGFVWRTVAQLRDLVAAKLDGFDSYVAYPALTGRSAHQFTTLQPVELDCYQLDSANKGKLARFVGEKRIAGIVYMSALPAMLDMAFLRGLGVVTINTEEDSFDRSHRDHFAKRIAKFVVRRVLNRQLHDLHIANSASQGEWLARYAQIPARRIAVIPNGVDTGHYVPASGSEPSVLDPARRWVICVSQARPEKRIDLILRCAARMSAQDEFADVSFVYVGDGEMTPHWRQLAHELRIDDRFLFAGQQSDLRAFYQASYLMVHAARRESFGLVLAEAMACGLPVVASEAAGPSEIVVDGFTGKLVGLDDEQAFYAAIADYLRDPNLARAHGAAGRQRALERYSIHRQARDMAAAIAGAAGQ